MFRFAGRTTPGSVAGRVKAARIDHLVGVKNFVRHNPRSDLFPVEKFHHVEFWCPDATNAYKRFQLGLGMSLVAKSDQGTGNTHFGSYVLQSDELVFAFTAPYSAKQPCNGSMPPHPKFKQEDAFRFLNAHGFGVRALGVRVEDAAAAFDISVSRGAVPVTAPVYVRDDDSGLMQVFSEVRLYGDVVMRYVSGDFDGPFLAQYASVRGPRLDYGLTRLDHAVGNVYDILDTANHIVGFTGFHQFAEFTAEDIGTLDSGLNNVVLANNNEHVLLLVNEPTFGTKRKSQIQTYLEQNEGPGLQHLAMKTNDIFSCMRSMRAVSEIGGFEFMPRATDEYYRTLPDKIGDALTPEQYAAVEEMGIFVDKDDQGVLLQIFTKPVSDRATLFLEIIQRVGCEEVTKEKDGSETVFQVGGCGGFGKGNISELFRSVEEYERSLLV